MSAEDGRVGAVGKIQDDVRDIDRHTRAAFGMEIVKVKRLPVATGFGRIISA